VARPFAELNQDVIAENILEFGIQIIPVLASETAARIRVDDKSGFDCSALCLERPQWSLSQRYKMAALADKGKVVKKMRAARVVRLSQVWDAFHHTLK
jgi:hypothetical protein